MAPSQPERRKAGAMNLVQMSRSLSDRFCIQQSPYSTVSQNVDPLIRRPPRTLDGMKKVVQQPSWAIHLFDLKSGKPGFDRIISISVIEPTI